MSDIAADPDDLYGEQVVFALEIKVRRNGSMSVAGGINYPEYAYEVLDKAKECIRSHRARQAVENGGLIVPAHDAPKLIV